jgi:hypothetical protein
MADVEALKERQPLVEGVDFYREGAYVVFTAAYGPYYGRKFCSIHLCMYDLAAI